MVKLGLNEKGDDWILLPKGSKEEGSIYMDGRLYESFSNAKGVMKKKKLDLVIACSGYPGLGKSKLISQTASFCDPSFTEDRMWQTTEDFVNAVKNETGILKAHVLDEAWEGLSSGQVRRKIGRVLLNIMNVIRQKRLYIFIVLPDFFDLSKSIAIFRSRWLIHCYSEEFGDIGRFAAFDQGAKKQLYIRGKRFEDYGAWPADFYGSFTKGDSPNFNWDRYEKEIKPKSMINSLENSESNSDAIDQRNELIFFLYNEHNYKTKDIAKKCGISLRSIQQTIRDFKKSNRDPSA